MNSSISLKSIRYTSIPVLSFRHFVVPSKDLGSFRSKDKLPYARPYIFTLLFTLVYVVERLVLQTIYVLNKEIIL